MVFSQLLPEAEKEKDPRNPVNPVGQKRIYKIISSAFSFFVDIVLSRLLQEAGKERKNPCDPVNPVGQKEFLS